MSKLIIENLHIQNHEETLVHISFTIEKSTALIGQSGSGKSLTLKSILGLLPSNLTLNMRITSEFDLNSETIGFVPQNPFTSLSPMTKITQQFFCQEKRKIELLALVGLEKWVLNRFPNQLSGGQIQRVIIALALTKNPKLLLLDEPTTALDTKSKTTIIELIQTIQAKLNLLVLYVTHDINSIVNLCEQLIIIKNGFIIESGLSHDILQKPKEAYTKELINSGFNNRNFRE
ncbi:MAG: ATP-binding cassette domain-containing protein [Candidatus Marinarcus sp.]|uniref:ATP-binding cassette domain-containing protein n=1 Tax=Candidatus Marinarcus sp. TaxID=3100987 RepID=UPI003B009C1D